LIGIRVFRDNPAEAARIANAIAEAYRDFRVEQGRARAGAGARTIKAQLDAQESKVKQAEAELEKIRKQLRTSEEDSQSPDGARLVNALSAQRLEAMRVDAERVLVGKQDLLAALKSKSPEALRASLPTAVNPPDYLLIEFLGQLSFAEQQLAKLQKDLGPEHTQVLRAKAQFAEVNRKIDERIAGILAGLEASTASAKAQLESLSEAVDKARAEELRLQETHRPFYDKKRELEELIRFRNILRLKLLSEEADLTLPSSGPVEIVDRAVPALHPSRPNKPLNIALGTLAGALLSLLAGGLTLAFPSRGFRTTVLALAGLPLACRRRVVAGCVAFPSSAWQPTGSARYHASTDQPRRDPLSP
jgi:succinoglycan biosynthesis transport protein ExoP